MKIAVCYATNSKTTAKCAAEIASRLSADCFDISKRRRKADISGYDAVIVGSPVRMGQLHDGAVVFMSQNKELLKQKKTAYFLCCGFPENIDTYFETLFPQSLLEKAVWRGSLGGELVLSRLPLFDRMMMRDVARANGELPAMEIDYTAIDSLCETFSG